MDIGASSYRRYLDGDDTGIAEIIKEYKDGLTLYINGYVNNIFTAEDLMEETFFKLAAKRPHFSGKCTFKTWLFAIARNVTIDYLRKNSKVTSDSIDEYADYLAEERQVEEEYLVKEQKITLHRIMNKLKNEYFQILYLIYFEDFSNAQAAVIMKKNKRQIENLVYRAKQALKSELIKEGFEYEKL
ncbi:MAG: RNA polymerase sigma factor [Clostridia bacterium]|nr:RNA polymerase sigma factor [Clostridia bacterium]